MVKAYVNHGSWVANCPNCNSAELVSPGQARFQCGFVAPPRFPGGAPSQTGCLYKDKLSWPSDWEAIEAVLNARPEARNRNWRPGETVADLRIENAAHQLPSGLGVAS